MNTKYPLRAFDGTNTSDVQVLNVPAGAIDANGEIDLGQGIKVYRALLTQKGPGAPVATVLENTLGGTVVWSYVGTGDYAGTLTGAFELTKTLCLVTNGNSGAGGGGYGSFALHPIDSNGVQLLTTDNTGALADDKATTASVQILVYP